MRTYLILFGKEVVIYFFDLRFESYADSLQVKYQLRDYSEALMQLNESCKELGYRSVVFYRGDHDARFRYIAGTVEKALNEFVSQNLVRDSHFQDGKQPLGYRVNSYSNDLISEAKRLARNENALGRLPEIQKKGLCCSFL